MSNGYAVVSPSNGWQFTNTRVGDFVFYTESNNQQLLLGVNSNVNASLTLASNFSMFSGNLGVGTTTPFARMVISGGYAANSNNLVIQDTAGLRAGLQIQHTSAPTPAGTTANFLQINQTSAGLGVIENFAGDIQCYTRSNFRFYTKDATTGNFERLTVLNNGNVGVGTATPVYKLEINGNTRIGNHVMYTDGYQNFFLQHSNLSSTGLFILNGNPTGETYGRNFSAGIQFRNSSTTDNWSIMGPITNFSNRLYFYWSVYARGYLDTAVDVTNIDFTGQHRSYCEHTDIGKDQMGLIVESSGEYKSLSGSASISVNEALPIVQLCSTARCKRVYGVVSDIEDESDDREYKVGTFVTVTQKTEQLQYLIINSVGEGGIWVCDANGDLENGDYITSSDVPGYGMKQDETTLHNFTVAKITCDCKFNELPSWIEKRSVTHNNATYMCAFVGCTYHCG